MNNGYFYSLACKEFDQFNELAKGWDVDFRAISSSPNEDIQLFQSFTGQTQLSFAHFDLSVKQQARSPEGLRTIAILPPDHPDLLWCGKHISGEQVLLFNDKGEMDSISKSGFEVFTLSVPEQWLKQSLDNCTSIRLTQNEQVIRCDKPNISKLYRKLTDLSDTLLLNRTAESPKNNPQDAALFEGLTTLLEAANHHTTSAAKERRMKVLGDALHFIHSRRERVAVSEICYYANVSERTLERLFSKVIGIPPKRYLHLFLLQEAHSDLKKSSPENTTVSAIAYKFGFTHLGQFSADYFHCFNNLPSNTLNGR